MDPATKIDVMRTLALLPLLVFLPLAAATLITPVRVYVERRLDRRENGRRDRPL